MQGYDQEGPISASIRREVEKAEREKDNEAQIDVAGDLASRSVTVEGAVEKKFGSKFLGALWAKYVVQPGRDDAAIGVRGRFKFGRKE